MKRTIILFSLLGLSIVANAQFRIHQSGNISISSLETPLSLLSINSGGSKYYDIYGVFNKFGIKCISTGYDNGWGRAASFEAILDNRGFISGITGEAKTANSVECNNGRSFGVTGIAGFATSGWNYGVFGRIKGTHRGAAIYGTTDVTENGIPLDKRYAGYFNGDVGVNGDLTVNGNIEGVLLGSSADLSLSSRSVSMEDETESVAAKIAGFNAIPYYRNISVAALSTKSQGDTIATTREVGLIEAQANAKMHYALSAEQLENVFPELVYENEDGTKAINYLEIIPLLVQSISELNAKISVLETENGRLKMPATANEKTGINEATVVGKASLAQNKPNPFGAKTIIGMNIPEESKTALLCIYDMNGKQLKQITIADRGDISFAFAGDGLDAGIYMYSLIVDGKLVNTRRMILTN